MGLFEASGDIFFNGDWEKGKAVSFYRVGVLCHLFMKLIMLLFGVPGLMQRTHAQPLKQARS